MSITVQQIKQFAVYADKVKNGGNENGYVDGSEVELFKKKVKTVDRNIDVDSIIKDYQENKVQKEAEYDNNGTLSNSTVNTAIISSFNSDSYLRANDKYQKTASTIQDGIKTFDKGVWGAIVAWWNDDEELLTYTDMIDENNVLDVVSDNETIEKIANADHEVRPQAGETVISALIAAADKRHIDVSNIVVEKDGEYVVGRDVADKEFGTLATDKENLEAVVKALRDAVTNGKKTVAGQNNKKEEMLTIAAKRIDAQGNGNGYIDTDEETELFKQFAAQHGYDINTVLEEIRDNETNGVENTTALQKTVFNIFDPEQRAALDVIEANNAKNVSKAFKDGVNNDNIETLEWAASQVSADNVMEIFADAENDDLIDKLVDKYDYFWQFWKEDTYQNYTSPILASLIEYAKRNGIEIDDIVLESGNGYITGSASGVKTGKKAEDADNVAAVIKALRDRIKSEQV
ncbi:MAG: hypothetical protein LUB59_03100 [Candidatus Gastranaerophilales bacterium]|nr:hypothetical protein [Candidatus Gastranaerophilales bacterium]